MKHFRLKPLIAAALVAGSFCAMSVRAGDLDVASNLSVQSDISDAAGGGGIDSSVASNSFGGAHPFPNFTPAAGTLGDQIEDSNSVDAARASDDWALLAPFAVPHVNLDITGPDSIGTLPNMAVGPQYTLNNKVTLGGSWEGSDNVAFGAHPNNDPYTFGLRVVF